MQFRFNLLKKTIAELKEKEEKKDNSFLISSAILFSFVVFALSLFYIETYVVDRQLLEKESMLTKYRNDINQRNGIVDLKHKLYLKMLALDPIIDFDINLSNLISKANALINQYNNEIKISLYSRESDGSLGLIFSTGALDITRIVNILENNVDVSQVVIRNISYEAIESTYIVNLRIYLKQ
jgi:hypothetical protein